MKHWGILISWSSKRLLEVWKAQKKPWRSLSGMETRDVLFCLNVVLLMSLSSQYVVSCCLTSWDSKRGICYFLFLHRPETSYVTVSVNVALDRGCLFMSSASVQRRFCRTEVGGDAQQTLKRLKELYAPVGAVWSQFVRFSWSLTQALVRRRIINCSVAQIYSTDVS